MTCPTAKLQVLFFDVRRGRAADNPAAAAWKNAWRDSGVLPLETPFPSRMSSRWATMHLESHILTAPYKVDQGTNYAIYQAASAKSSKISAN
jgi:hypothetical protein